jgi:hypothetical protein
MIKMTSLREVDREVDFVGKTRLHKGIPPSHDEVNSCEKQKPVLNVKNNFRFPLGLMEKQNHYVLGKCV